MDERFIISILIIWKFLRYFYYFKNFYFLFFSLNNKNMNNNIKSYSIYVQNMWWYQLMTVHLLTRSKRDIFSHYFIWECNFILLVFYDRLFHKWNQENYIIFDYYISGLCDFLYTRIENKSRIKFLRGLLFENNKFFL